MRSPHTHIRRKSFVTAVLALLMLAASAVTTAVGADSASGRQNPGKPFTGCQGGLGNWSYVASHPAGALESPAVASDSTYLYAAGGFVSGGSSSGFYRFDPATNVWSGLAHLPQALHNARAVYAPNVNKVFVFGGYSGGVLNTTYIYDVASNTWTTGALMPDPLGRYYPGVVY